MGDPQATAFGNRSGSATVVLRRNIENTISHSLLTGEKERRNEGKPELGLGGEVGGVKEEARRKGGRKGKVRGETRKRG